MGLRESRAEGSAKDQKEPLHVLVRKGHYDSAHCLLSQRTYKVVNKKDGSSRTPLFWATEYRHEDLVELLLTHGADVAVRDQEGNTCLHWAASVGCTPIARRLLQAGAEVNTQNNQGDSPLHVAARERRYQCLVLLLAHGANVSLANRAGQTPLQCARLNSPPWSAMKAFVSLPEGIVERTLSRDISRGFERIPIPCLNGVDSEPCPKNFLYVTQNILSDSIDLTSTEWIRTQCCDCTRTCSLEKCPCIQRSLRFWYNPDGQLVPTASNDIEMGHIYECHVLCSCSSFCTNRVVQWGLRTQLQLFKTPDKGWGVRTMQDLPKGTFVCQYFGELISVEEIAQREENTYHYKLDSEVKPQPYSVVLEGKSLPPMEGFGELISVEEIAQREENTYHYKLDSEDGEDYYLDGNFYGSVGRFLNHSCNPNLLPVRVTINQEVPIITFFTSQAIEAGKELGFDYGDQYWQGKGLNCQCKSSNCRFQLLPALLPPGEPRLSSQRPLRGFAFKSRRKSPLKKAE